MSYSPTDRLFGYTHTNASHMYMKVSDAIVISKNPIRVLSLVFVMKREKLSARCPAVQASRLALHDRRYAFIVWTQLLGSILTPR